MNKRIALYTPPLPTIHSYMEMVDFAAENGFSYIETINCFELQEPNLDFAKRLRQYADEKNITFCCVSVGLDLVGEDGEDAIQKVKGYADVAKILGSPYLHHTICFEFSNPQRVVDNYDLFYQRGMKAVREIFDYSSTLGIQCIYEDQGYLFNGVKGFQKFLNEVDRNIGVVADFGNIKFVDESVEYFIPEYADRVVNVHVKDYLVTSKGEREKRPEEYVTYHGNYLEERPLGKGSVDFKASFEQLAAMNYQGTIALECSPTGDDSIENFKHNIQYLTSCIENWKEI